MEKLVSAVESDRGGDRRPVRWREVMTPGDARYAAGQS